MSETKFDDPAHGWTAECRDCPGVIEPLYGAVVYPHREYSAAHYAEPKHEAQQWARRHVDQHPEHAPKVSEFMRWTMTVTDWSPELLAKIFGPVGEPSAHPPKRPRWQHAADCPTSFPTPGTCRCAPGPVDVNDPRGAE